MLRPRLVLLALCTALVSGLSSAQVDRVSYTVRYREDVKDRCAITMALSGKPAVKVDLEIPTWSPGAYEIKPFYKRISEVTATSAKGEKLKVQREGNTRWRVVTEGAEWPVTVAYDKLEMRDGFADDGTAEPRERAYSWLLPTATFLYVVDARTVPHDVAFDLPEGWLVQMALAKGADARHFSAPDYDTFVDAPVELGEIAVHRFTVGKATYSIVLDRRDRNFRVRSLEELLRRIIRHAVGMWGGEAPYGEYQFHIHDGPGYGLEHLTSTTIAVPFVMLRMMPGQFDSLLAHEYFHLWNVKRLRPKVLGPFDYAGPNKTRALWLSEGITDYYADLICWRTGIWRDDKYLDTLRGEIEHLQATDARKTESVEDASWASFDRGYSEFGSNKYVDYYNKGKLIGLCLDLTIRQKTGDQKSLDDVMRGLYAKYALPKPGFEEDALPKDFSELAGFDLTDFFKKYVSGKDELPIVELLATMGVDAKGGGVDTEKVTKWMDRSSAEWNADGIKITKLHARLKQLGLEEGDLVVQVGGKKPVKPADADASPLVALLPADGQGTSPVEIQRGSARLTVSVEFPEIANWRLKKTSAPTEAQAARFKALKADPYTEKVTPGETLDTVGIPAPSRER